MADKGGRGNEWTLDGSLPGSICVSMTSFLLFARISKKRREKKRKKDLLSLTLNFFIYSSSRTERKNRDSSFLFFFLLFSSLEHACNREWDENGTQRGIKLVCTGV